MKNYVLVHGAEKDGSVWDKVADILRKQGNTVFCPTMTPIDKASLTQNIDEIIQCINSNNLENIILVGHSYSGMVITGVTDKIGDKVDKLVFLDSFIAKDGQSLYSLCESVGFGFESHGMQKNTLTVEEIHYDPEKVFSRPKVYIPCLQGVLVDLTNPIYEKLKNKGDDWLFFSLDGEHFTIIDTHSKEIATILLGIQTLEK